MVDDASCKNTTAIGDWKEGGGGRRGCLCKICNSANTQNCDACRFDLSLITSIPLGVHACTLPSRLLSPSVSISHRQSQTSQIPNHPHIISIARSMCTLPYPTQPYLTSYHIITSLRLPILTSTAINFESVDILEKRSLVVSRELEGTLSVVSAWVVPDREREGRGRG